MQNQQANKISEINNSILNNYYHQCDSYQDALRSQQEELQQLQQSFNKLTSKLDVEFHRKLQSLENSISDLKSRISRFKNDDLQTASSLRNHQFFSGSARKLDEVATERNSNSIREAYEHLRELEAQVDKMFDEAELIATPNETSLSTGFGK